MQHKSLSATAIWIVVRLSLRTFLGVTLEIRRHISRKRKKSFSGSKWKWAVEAKRMGAERERVMASSL